MMVLCRLPAVVLSSIILRKKVRPAGTTWAAELRVPMRDCLELCMWPDRWVREVWISCSLTGESWALSREESRMIPRYSRVVEGPSNLLSARGTPRALHRELRMQRWCVTVLMLVHLPRRNHPR